MKKWPKSAPRTFGRHSSSLCTIFSIMSSLKSVLKSGVVRDTIRAIRPSKRLKYAQYRSQGHRPTSFLCEFAHASKHFVSPIDQRANHCSRLFLSDFKKGEYPVSRTRSNVLSRLASSHENGGHAFVFFHNFTIC